MDVNEILLAGAAAYATHPQGLIAQIYKDALSPAVQQVGTALGECVELIRYPQMLATGKTRLKLKAALDSYGEMVKHRPAEQLVQVAPEVGVPALESLMYVTDETVREMFLRLLAAASDKDRQRFAHPSFVHMINRLSPDDAHLLVKLVKDKVAPFVRLYFADVDSRGLQSAQFALKIEDEDLSLAYSENVEAYVSNLSSLGLIRLDERALIDFDYAAAFSKSIENVRAHLSAKLPSVHREDGHIMLTDLGKMFAKAVLTAPKED